MSSRATDVAVIGAGPYGLSIASNLREGGVDFRVFGTPMKFWLTMPPTLNLKSFAFATSIHVPRPSFTFPDYCRANGLEDFEPCTMECFAAYGLWLQRKIVPDVEDVEVASVRARDGDFEVTLATGDRFKARRVVIAVGLTHFAHMPEPLAGLPRELVSHTSDHRYFDAFKGKEVAVLGRGASALEAATLLHEAGARPVVLARGPQVVFHTKFDRGRPLRERILQPNSVLGPGRKSWVLENFPTMLHYVPDARRVRFTRNHLGPAGPWWLHDRFRGNVAVRTRCTVVRAEAKGGRVQLGVREDGEERALEFDHVVAGTGFVVDVDRLPFLDPVLRSRVRRIERAPALSRHFETSVPGLFFVGTASAYSFGPLMRFVCGTTITSPIVAKRVMTGLRGSPVFARLASLVAGRPNGDPSQGPNAKVDARSRRERGARLRGRKTDVSLV